MQNLTVETRQLNDCLHEAIFLVVFYSRALQTKSSANEIATTTTSTTAMEHRKKVFITKTSKSKTEKQQIKPKYKSTKVKNYILLFHTSAY